MSPPTLYKICVEKTCALLRDGRWKPCPKNPFSFLPPSIVQKLFDSILSLEQIEWFQHSDVPITNAVGLHVLLTSGQLENCNLLELFSDVSLNALLQMMSLGCQNLQTLVLPNVWYDKGNVSRALEILLQRSPHLEELHSSAYFHPKHLQNCRELRTLRLHFEDEILKKFYLKLSPKYLKCLHSLEVFSVCFNPLAGDVCYLYDIDKRNEVFIRLPATVLDNCPKITSLELLESSFALKHLLGRHWTECSGSRTFQLRHCFWGLTAPNVTEARPSQLISLFPDMIRCAVASFPLVEVLVMDALHLDSLQHLAGLKNLHSLDIRLDCVDEDYPPKLYSLLNEIGSRLKHLSVRNAEKSLRPINPDMLCDACPNLESLYLVGSITVDERVRPRAKPLPLKRLYSGIHRPGSLLFLLSSSVHLKALFVLHAYDLDDRILLRILRNDSWAELEVAGIFGCSVSPVGLRKLILGTPRLKNFCFHSDVSDRADVKRIVAEMNPAVVICYDDHINCFASGMGTRHYKREFPHARHQWCDLLPTVI